MIILYITGALGDLILSTPSLSAIRKFAGSTHIHGIAPQVLYDLYPNFFDSFTNINSGYVAKLFSDDALQTIKKHTIWKMADTAIVFDRAKSSLPDYLENTKYLKVFRINASFEKCKNMHYSQYVYNETLKTLSISIPFNIVSPVMKIPVKEISSQYALVHPGSGSKLKNCPSEIIIKECIRVQGEKKLQWVLISGEADKEAVRSFIEKWNKPVIHFHCLNLCEIVWYLRKSLFYVGNDSGISHLAGVAGASGTVFFGPTSPDVWKPLGNCIKIKFF